MDNYKKRCPIDGGTCGQGGTCFICENESLGAGLAAAKARISALEKALEPFAREEVSGMYKDAWHLQFSDPEGFVDFTDFTIGDLRRAAALLKEKE